MCIDSKPPKPPVAGPKAHDQINLTDEQSRIMPVAGGGFDQASNAQAAVDTDSMLVIALDVTQACNDKEQVVLMLEQLATLPASLGHPKALLADTGFYRTGNVEACEAHGIDPFIAVKRDPHHPAPHERFTEPAALPAGERPAGFFHVRLGFAADCQQQRAVVERRDLLVQGAAAGRRADGSQLGR